MSLSLSLFTKQDPPKPTTEPVPTDYAAYASAVIASVGAQAAYDFESTPENRERLLEANRTLRQIRDAKQRVAAQKAGW